MRYSDPRSCWRELLLETCRIGPPRRHSTIELVIDGPCETVRIADAGFHPNRWVAFCDDYLAGGPEFEDFLSCGGLRYRFYNWGGHRKGGCLTRLDLGQRLLISRASNWVPTGILDLKLVNMTMRRTGVRRLTWRIEDLNVDPFMASASVDFPSVGESVWYQRARSIVDGTSRVKLLGCHEKALRRHLKPLDTDESEIEESFIHFTPEDVARLAKTSGRSVRNFLRAHSGRLRGAGYAWNSTSSPEAKALLSQFGLTDVDIPKVAMSRAQLGRRGLRRS